MKDYKILLISFVLLIFMIGAVSAVDVNSSDDVMATNDESTVGIDLPGIIIPDIPIGPGDDDDEPVDVEVTTKEIYVSDTGNDSNVGSKESPYATVKKAYSDVNASNDATIHIGEGTFFLEGSTFHYYEDYGDGDIEEWDEEYNGLYIDLNHKSFGGNLKFIGAGADKTFLDGQSAFYFATINSKANVLIKDVTFINCKNYNGGTISNEGNLTIENCIFKDSYATNNKGGAIAATGSGGGMIIIGEPTAGGTSLTVKNSQFISSSVNSYEQWGWQPQGGGAIYVYNIDELYLENNTFINNKLSPQGGTGVAVYSTQTKTYLINNKFINLTGPTDGAIFINPADSNGSKQSVITGNQFINCSSSSESYSIAVLESGYHKFENNTFINSSNAAGNIFAGGYVDSLKFDMDDAIINISNAEINNGVKIPFNVTDDMGNIVTTSNFNIKLTNENNSYTFSPSVNNGIISIGFTNVPENGIYDLTISYNGGKSTTDVLTTVNISTLNDPIDLYVSPEGSDVNNGTLENPFATIQHAIDVGFEKSFTVNVHLLKGTYSGDGNVELVIANKGNLNLTGEKYNETVIDGNNTSWLISVSTTNVNAENLKFVNGLATRDNSVIMGSNLYLKDCIVDNNSLKVTNAYVMNGVRFKNLVYTNNKGSIYYGYSNNPVIISDGYFANNDNSETNYGVLYFGTRDVTVENCTFINNTAKQYGSAIYSNYAFTSRNNWYEGNKAPNKAVFYISDYQNYNYVFENDTFVNNKATSGYYGVTGPIQDRNNNRPTLTFTDCKFINNSAVKGGAIGLKQGTITNCEFINNSADYGGAIIIAPFNERLNYNEIVIENTVFDNNRATINGKDIYVDDKLVSGYHSDLILLTINFNDLNVSSLVDTLTVNVTGPCGAIVGGGSIDLELNGTKIGTSEIIDGLASFNYAGFEDGVYIFSGKTDYAFEGSTFTNGTVNVKLEGILDNVEFWVSNDGSDENGNGSESNPFKSISHAVGEATKNCRNIKIHIADGVYTGDLNTALELSAMNNLTLIGSGVDKTFIDGENSTYFATIAAGNNRVTISNLTIRNMLPDNRVSRAISDLAPITIIEGANLLLDTVEIVDNHGGNAIIINSGNLVVNNSAFKRNGFTQIAVICGGNGEYSQNIGGNVIIDNTLFEDNYVYKSNAHMTIITCDNLVINNSVIKNGYLFADNIYGAGFALINFESNAQGNVTIENTNISNDGSIDALKELGVNTDGKLVNPALDVNGNVYMNNCSMVNNFNGTLNTDTQVASITWVSAFGYTYTVPRNVTVVNSSILNYQFLWMATTYNVHNFIFDGCVFENLDYLAWIRTNNPDSNYNITNSVFLNCSNVIKQNHYAPMATPQHVNLNDNYWGSNDKPIIYFLDQDVIKDDVVEPDTWIILTSEDEQTVIKNLTDGENITAYTGNAPIRTDYADNDGALDYAVVFGPVGYLFTTDDDKNVIFNPEDAMYPFVAADPMDYRTPSVITITGLSGDLNIVGVLVDPVGNPIANATISSIIDGVNVANVTTDDNGTFTVKGIKNGVLTILFNGTVDYFDAEYNLTFADAGKTTKSFINLDAIESDLTVKGTLVDDEGNPIANATITYTVNGENATNVTTDADGVFQVQAASDAVVDIVFAGSDVADPVNTTLTIKGLATLRSATVIEGNNFTQNAIEYGAGERGGNFTVQLKDANGNVLANKTVLIGYNGKVLERVTNATGHASVQINLKDENRLTFAVAFLGDEDYNATMSVYLITIAKKPVTMTAAAKSFKAAAKSKKYSVTLKTVKGASADGKTYFAAGKVVKLSVNGKTYTAKTNAKGQATFNLKLTKKGKFTAKVSYAGDKTYNAVSKSVKLTIN